MLRGMGLDGLDKNESTLAELEKKGMRPPDPPRGASVLGWRTWIPAHQGNDGSRYRSSTELEGEVVLVSPGLRSGPEHVRLAIPDLGGGTRVHCADPEARETDFE